MSLSSYGYIAGDAEIHFLRHVVAGTSVEVDVVENGTGFEATRVALLQCPAPVRTDRIKRFFWGVHNGQT